MPRATIGPATLLRWCGMRNQGLSAGVIAAREGVSIYAVRYHLDAVAARRGITWPRVTQTTHAAERRWSEAEDAALVAAVRRGESRPAIASAMGRSYKAVTQRLYALRLAGAAPRSSRRAVPPPPRPAPPAVVAVVVVARVVHRRAAPFRLENPPEVYAHMPQRRVAL